MIENRGIDFIKVSQHSDIIQLAVKEMEFEERVSLAVFFQYMAEHLLEGLNWTDGKDISIPREMLKKLMSN